MRAEKSGEESRVVAVIHVSGDVYYFDVDARDCDNVHECILNKVSAIKNGDPKIYESYCEEICELRLNERDHPTTFARQVAALTSVGLTEEEAIREVKSEPIVLEVYRSKCGIFAVLSDCAFSGEIRDPYTGSVLTEN